MRNAPVSISEYMYVGQVTRYSCRRKQYCDCRQEYCCPQPRHRVSKARILPSGNGIIRLAIETVRSERGNFLSDNGISSKKMAVISVRDGNVAVKKGSIAVGDRNVEVGDRNVEVGDGNEGVRREKVAVKIEGNACNAQVRKGKIKITGQYNDIWHGQHGNEEEIFADKK